MRIFVLGAADPEMNRIEQHLATSGEVFVYAMNGAQRVRPNEAYNATPSYPLPDDAEVVCVECSLSGIAPAVVIDHHREGDHGFGVPPERFMEGSSLGQVLALLGIKPDKDDLYIAAGDHCPVAAYKGQCPGVGPDELFRRRIAQKAEFKKVGVEAVMVSASHAMDKLARCQKIKGVHVVREHIEELPEIAMYTGSQYIANLADGKVVASANAAVITKLKSCPALEATYGDPVRGYMGGTLKEGCTFDDVIACL